MFLQKGVDGLKQEILSKLCMQMLRYSWKLALASLGEKVFM